MLEAEHPSPLEVALWDFHCAVECMASWHCDMARRRFASGLMESVEEALWLAKNLNNSVDRGEPLAEDEWQQLRAIVVYWATGPLLEKA